MKRLIDKILISLSLLFMFSCSSKVVDSPSHSDALHSISNSGMREEKGSLQTTLDDFLNNNWTPTLEQNTEKSFTLQEFVDKTRAYLEAHPSEHNTSHAHKVESMPIIGERKGR